MGREFITIGLAVLRRSCWSSAVMPLLACRHFASPSTHSQKRHLTVSHTFGLRYLAEASGLSGQVVEGLLAIDQALEGSERNEEHWCTAELLRIKGDLLPIERRRCGSRCGRRLYLNSHLIGHAANRRCRGNCEPRSAFAVCASVRERRTGSGASFLCFWSLHGRI